MLKKSINFIWFNQCTIQTNIIKTFKDFQSNMFMVIFKKFKFIKKLVNYEAREINAFILSFNLQSFGVLLILKMIHQFIGHC